MRILDYIYYKFYKGLSRTPCASVAEFAASAYLACFIVITICTTILLLAKKDFITISSARGAAKLYALSVLFLLSMLFYFIYKGRHGERAIAKYSTESNRQRIYGNLFVISIVTFTFVMIYVVGFYKPGYWGK